MSSNSIVIKKFGTIFLEEMYGVLEEYSFSGNDPRNHTDWKHFLKELKKIHSENIFGTLILSKKINCSLCYSLFLIPRQTTKEEYIKLTDGIITKKDHTIVDFIQN